MPIYEYRCADGHTFEVFRSMSDDPVTECEVCGKPVERVFHPVAVHFKGSGFYTTDYARKGAAKADGAKDSESSNGAEKKSAEKQSSDSKSSGAPDSKPAGSKPEKPKSSSSSPD